MKNMIIYPYGREAEPLVRHAGLLNGYVITGLSSPRSWGMAGKKVDMVSGEECREIEITPELSEFLCEEAVIYVPEFHAIKQFEDKVVDNLIGVIPKVDEILCSAKLSNTNSERLESACRQHGKSKLKTLQFSNTPSLMKDICVKDERLLQSSVPIIAIVGLWNDIDKFDISLSLREELMKDGYSVLQIGSRNCSELFGFSSFPDFVFAPHIGEEEKIHLLNRYVVDLAEKEKPDVIVVTVPGAMQNLSEEFTNGFGILHYLVFQALSVDYLIDCTFYEAKAVDFLKEISQSCRYKYGVPVNCHHMSNLFIDMMQTKESKIVKESYVPRQMVNEAIKSSYYRDSGISIFNGLDQDDFKRLYRNVIDELTGNPERL